MGSQVSPVELTDRSIILLLRTSEEVLTLSRRRWTQPESPPAERN